MKTEDHLDAIFGALAHATRRSLLARLREGEAGVSELAEPHGMSLPAISRHLKVLEQARLIGRSVDGKFRSCHLLPDAAGEATAWLEEHRTFWTGQLDALAEYAETLRTEKKHE
jgi:DNA-binding transcriptional ArsR family regulator